MTSHSKTTGVLGHYECHVCGYDDDEAGTGPWPPGDYWCPMCAEDNGRDVRMTCTPIAEASIVTRF